MKTRIVFITFFCFFLLNSCKKNNDDNENKICFYQKFEPSIVVKDYESYTIDIDDGENDVFFYSNQEIGVYDIEINTSKDVIMLSRGRNVYSGSGVTIYKNDKVNSELLWQSTLHFSRNSYAVEYIGIRKKVGEIYYYGWMDVYKTDETFILEKVYFYKSDDAVVYAGIQNENCVLN